VKQSSCGRETPRSCAFVSTSTAHMDPRERIGIAAGIASSAMGGMAAAVTRYAVTTMDPVLISTFRFGIGCLVLLPFAVATRARWPRGVDLVATAALGVMFYAVYFVAYARALTFTTAARGSLAIATLPVLTMLVAAALGKERLTLRKTLGVLTALAGVMVSLMTDLSRAPVGAWKGDAIMIAAMLSMSVYTIYSRPLMARSSALGYACAGMAAGATLNATVASWSGGWAALDTMGAPQWAAALFLGVVPGAIGFFLWVYAIQRTTPTRAAATITISPICAGALAAVLVSEPFGIGLMVGAVAVAAGIWIASTERQATHGRASGQLT
jgi:drug/metabolite transporter (DMT)-like permease